MNHLTELLERLNDAKSTYVKADSSLDCSPLQVIVAKAELKVARFAWLSGCEEYILSNVLNNKEIENV
jgi:hypothetical protein